MRDHKESFDTRPPSRQPETRSIIDSEPVTVAEEPLTVQPEQQHAAKQPQSDVEAALSLEPLPAAQLPSQPRASPARLSKQRQAIPEYASSCSWALSQHCACSRIARIPLAHEESRKLNTVKRVKNREFTQDKLFALVGQKHAPTYKQACFCCAMIQAHAICICRTS